MAQKYKINGVVNIPSGLLGEDVVGLDSPIIEITQGRQADNTAFIGVTYTVKQGSLNRKYFVEYPMHFSKLNQDEMGAIIALITNANMNVLAMPQHQGAVKI